ncbi:HIT family protein [Paenisporosarcina sp. NPDC076898]|uniref:HIT family protein n=1 Tax=unclassified Paenisporosarcina TaxID=2642018 RepID=UPI003CFF2185
MTVDHRHESSDCLGCTLANKDLPVQVVFEDEFVCCILDHDPFNEGHTLILPKKHFRFVDEFDTETANAIMKAAQLMSKAIKKIYQPDGITVCQNGGTIDDLTHYHMHVVPRYENQSFASFFTEDPWDNEDLKKKLPNTRNELVKVISELLA